MGILEFVLICIVVAVIAYVGTWVLGELAPGHPAMIDKLIWFVAVGIIIITLLRATGILGHDIPIPRV